MNDTAPTNDHDMLIEMNANLKNLTATLQAYINASNTTIQDHETRLRVMEGQFSTIKGSQRSMKNVGTAVSILLTLATAIFAAIALTK